MHKRARLGCQIRNDVVEPLQVAVISLKSILTGGLACYRTYETADGRHLTLGALEPPFFARLTELLGRPELAERQFDVDQARLATELSTIFETRLLAEWLELFDREDVCVGPVATIAEAAADLG